MARFVPTHITNVDLSSARGDIEDSALDLDGDDILADDDQRRALHESIAVSLRHAANGDVARAGMTATVLTQSQLDTIEQWILQGAPP